MSKSTLLLVDNNQEYIESVLWFLNKEGFRVLTATSQQEAYEFLKKRGIDVAILDIRLENDTDAKDVTGIELAKKIGHFIPIIMLTQFPSYETVREALAPQLDGLSPAVDFVAKPEGPQALLKSIQKALRPVSGPIYYQEIAESIDQDYNDARQQAKSYFWLSVAVAIFGVAVIFVSVLLAILGHLEVGVPGIVAGVITESVGYLIFNQSAHANRRMDHYHRELLENQQFQNLLEACEQLNRPENQEINKMTVIASANTKWLGVPPSVTQISKLSTETSTDLVEP